MPKSSGVRPTDTRPIALPFRQDVQGLRGLAVLLVVLYHAGGVIPGGYVGVDVFFVVSGFLIGGLLLRELDVTGAIDLPRFFSRRVRRLLPALAVTTSLVLVLSVFLISLSDALRPAASTGLAASLFVANLQLYRAGDYFGPSAELNPLLHTWSLSVEEQFYLALPLLVVALASILRGRTTLIRRGVVMALAFLSAVSILLSIYLARTGTPFLGLEEPSRLAFYLPVTRAWEFAAGVLLAAIPDAKLRRLPSWVGSLSGLIGLVSILGAALLFDDLTPFPSFTALLPVMGTVALLAAGSIGTKNGPVGAVGGFFELRPMTWLGDVSYSWYLWHWPSIVFARALWPGHGAVVLLAAALSLVPARFSLRLIEERFRRDSGITGRSALRLALASIALPIVISLGVLAIAASAEKRLASTGELAGLIADAQAAGNSMPDNPLDLTQSYDLAVVGDSHAAALFRGLSLRASETGGAYVVLAEQGCLFLSGPYTDLHCERWQDDTLETLRRADVRTIVIHGYATGRLTGFRRGRDAPVDLFTSDGRPVRDVNEAYRLYEQGLSAAVDALDAPGRRIIILSSVPDFRTSLLGRITAWQALRGASVADVRAEQVDLEEAARRNATLLAIQHRVAARSPRVDVIDAVPLVCREVCMQLEAGGVLVYADLDHVAIEGALRLADGLLDELRMTARK
jgi:peptidoglycan/LPS O-acetylase OafA/YrhL